MSKELQEKPAITRVVVVELTSCVGCPHRNYGFLSEPSDCGHGTRRVKDQFLCSTREIPDHCPLPEKL